MPATGPSDASKRSARWIVIAVLLFALVVRLGWGWTRPTNAASLAALPDQQEYWLLGRSLLEDGTLRFVDPRFGDAVYAFRMPGYPAVIAALGSHARLLRVFQAIVDTSTVLAAIWLARRWLSMPLSCLAGVFVAFDPIFVYFSGLVLSETVFAALLTWGVACLAWGRPPLTSGASRSTAVWWTGIVLLIASVYVRPSALPLPALMAATSLFASRGCSVRRAALLGLIAGVLTFAALLPWAARNHAVLGRWIFATTNDGFTLYDGWKPGATGASDLAAVATMPALQTISEVERSDALKQMAIESLRADPWHQLRLVPTRLGRLWSPVPLSAEYGSRPLYVAAAALHAVPLMMLAMIGLIRRGSMSGGAKAFILIPAIVTTLTYGLTVGSLRYRMPIHPTLALLAAAAWAGRPTRTNDVQP